MKNKLRIGQMLLLLAYACGIKGQDFNSMVDNLIDKSVPLIYPDSLNQLKEGSQKVLILDAREPEEFKVSHLPGAINVGYKNFDLEDLNLDKNAEIVVYCSVGYRSEKIGEKLQEAGYQSVHNLYGGIFNWVNEGNKVYEGENTETAKVHAYSKSWGKWLTQGEKVYE